MKELKLNGRPARAGLLLVAIAACFCLAGHAQDAAVPKHLQIARDFVANTKQENNFYQLKNRYTRMPGDLFATDWVVRTDCSGFVGDVFRRAGTGVLEQMQTTKSGTSYSLIDMHKAMLDNTAFTRITKVAELVPGDVVVWVYVAGRHDTNGHVLFVDVAPQKIKSRKPLVDGLDQYEITIIDTSQEAKSLDDTRYVSDEALRDENEARGKERGTTASKNFKGVGRGKIRLYADADGNLKGAAFGYAAAKFHPDQTDWNIAMGRPKIKL